MQSKLFWPLGIVAIIVIILTFYLLPLFLPLLLGLILAYLLDPLVVSLERRQVPHSTAIIIVYVFVAISIGLLGLYIVPALAEQLSELSEVLPERLIDLKEKVLDLAVRITGGKGANYIREFLDEISRKTGEFAVSLGAYVVASVPRVLHSLFIVFVSLVLSFYFLSDRREFAQFIYGIFPKEHTRLIRGVLIEINNSLGGYLRGLLIVSFLVGVLGFIAMLVLGVPYALLIGVIVGFTELIPYFGPVIGAIPGVILAFLISPSKGLWTIAAFVVIQQIEGLFLTPKIIGNHSNLHPITVILAVIGGEMLWGFGGMIIAVPLAAVLKSAFFSIYVRLVRSRLID
ncbi:MAG: AI-2E family transporter [Firmicutes bacterium]|nr:AI-2E family transporter [Bacillota bacterium]MDD4262973.1 AI-2E family transporter [Bacillota bacterium]MDD4693845.1 AI-2E family transporter [Bacillota bacterium]